jgi:putative tricarboxylic transport membrane protein
MSGEAQTDVEPRQAGGRLTYLLFLAGIVAVATGYTVMAFGMEWRVESGQIGPGFFPRLIGLTIIAFCLVAAARVVVRRSGEEAEAEGPAERNPGIVVLAAAISALFLVTFEWLGALLSCILFLILLLSVVNRGRHVTNVAVSLALPIGLYLLFEVLLDAGLPEGLVLPL